MKRVITFILTFCILVLSLASCGDDTSDKLDVKVDLNFTGVSDSQMYDTIAYFMANPNDYNGKTVAITALSSVNYCFSTNKITSKGIIALDPTNCCDAYFEVRTSDGKFPDIGKKATYIGKFGNGYIDVSDIKNGGSETKFDVDALSMSSSELYSFITNYKKNYLTDEYEDQNKTIRIIGHITQSGGYTYILGLDANGKTTWDLEIITSEDVTIPMQASGYLNPFEITGILKYYQEGTQLYPCIEVTSACKVIATFS